MTPDDINIFWAQFEAGSKEFRKECAENNPLCYIMGRDLGDETDANE